MVNGVWMCDIIERFGDADSLLSGRERQWFRVVMVSLSFSCSAAARVFVGRPQRWPLENEYLA